MSRVGKNEIQVPSTVVFKIDGKLIEFTARGITNQYRVHDLIQVVDTGVGLKVTPVNNSGFARSLWGTTQRNLSNIIRGLHEGFSTSIDLVGVGYRASVSGGTLTMQLGFSHDVVYVIPSGVAIRCDKPTSIVISGHDKQQINQVCADLRKHRPPEPYKGKGMIRTGEYVRRKEGKKK
jgi:large subunit ribosomal protein L6